MGDYLPRGLSLDETFIASGDLSTYQYRYVKQTANGTVAICGAGERILGILQNAPEDGKLAVVRTMGMSLLYVNAGTAIGVQDHLKSAALGVGVKGEAALDEVGSTSREVKASGLGTILVKLLDAVSISEDPAASTFIVVSPAGDDTIGSGSFSNPYATLTKAFTVWTATRHTIFVLSGDYEEAATLTWPSITGLKLVALGPVTVSNANSAAQVLLISPTYTAATFEATIEGPLNIAADTQIGLKIANANMTKKLNVYLDGLSAEMDTSGDSIDIAGTVAGQAIRLYAKDLDLEGLLHFTANDAGSRCRVEGSSLMGGITLAGAVAAEVTLLNTKVLTSGLTKASEWGINNVGCVYATDADPAVYTEFANAYDT